MDIPVILCGGSGTRLWPLSREASPKQFLKLHGEQSLFQSTALRAELFTETPPVVVCSHQYRFIVAEQLQQIGIKDAIIILEPVAKNTAMAVAVATQYALQSFDDSTLVFMPSDHFIDDEQQFVTALTQAVEESSNHELVTLGICPSEPSSAYGYIEQGDSIKPNIFTVKSFIEKPDREKAKELLATKKVYWNAGLFIAKAQSLAQLLEAHAPDLNLQAYEAIDSATKDLDFVRPAEKPYEVAQSLSFDIAIAEKATNQAVVKLNCGWSDLGAWAEVKEVKDKDIDGNVIKGDVLSKGVTNSYIHADSRLVAALGVDDVTIIETKDAVLVTKSTCSQDVRWIVEQLKDKGRSEAVCSSVANRPWGYYENLDIDDRFKVKRIIVKQGEQLSLQKHYHRSEHWVVVKGTARVQCDEKVFLLHENQSTYIPQTSIHRLENVGRIPLEIIEIQVGCYLGEDDIERYQDNYGRISAADSKEDVS
jgi:mannose-1-phosphate guanylyltransferase/mannose-6-phosphate isomerase